MEFFQTQILGMRWLYEAFGQLLSGWNSPWAGAVQFFLFDVLKITVLLCTLIFGVSYLQSYFPPDRSRKILGRFRGLGALTVSALLGTVTPFCSCSSIPLFLGFTAAGLPLGVTFAFLISSPMVDLGSLVLLMSIFGAKVAVLYVIFGLLVAIFGGFLIGKLSMEDQIEDFLRLAPKNPLESPKMTQRDRLGFAWDQMGSTFRTVFPYILLGVGLGAVIHNWIPTAWVQRILGHQNPFGVVLATLIGIPMYADIFGTIPVAEALLGKGAQLGTVLSMMMAVTTLSLPSIILLRRAVKPRLLALFLGICTLGIFAVGYLFNALAGLL